MCNIIYYLDVIGTICLKNDECSTITLYSRCILKKCACIDGYVYEDKKCRGSKYYIMKLEKNINIFLMKDFNT